ncbi:MAG: ABC transporter permease [Spirochaetales bacterium]|nr:ABC transporter permease [Spirochaetales bacterium]MCF7938431.1 ABC transporter permease [Spirochaetales bacterium]
MNQKAKKPRPNIFRTIRGYLNRYPLAAFILRRVGSMIPVLFITIFFFFFFMSLAPGDFFSAYYQNPEIDPEVIDYYRTEFGLDQPFYVQYVKWIKNVIVDGDLGMSFSYRQPILQLLQTRLWNTVFLNLVSLFFSFVIAYPIAFYFAYKPNRVLEEGVNFFTLILYSAPPFFLALIGLMIAASTGLFPLGGATSEGFADLSLWGRFLDRMHHVLLPVLVGFLGGIAGSIRTMKVLLQEEFHKPYITAVKAKGAGKWRLIFHAFRNALIPFITGISGILAGLIGGSLFVEIIFAYPGVGRLMYEATLRQDYYLVLTNMIIGDVLVLFGIMFSDILLAIADPRVRIK